MLADAVPQQKLSEGSPLALLRFKKGGCREPAECTARCENAVLWEGLPPARVCHHRASHRAAEVLLCSRALSAGRK